MTAEPLTLPSQFPEATADRWGNGVAALLSKGGRTLTSDQAIELLTHTTADGIVVQPLYTDAPTVATPAGMRRGRWEVRQTVDATDNATSGHGQALEELEKGSTAITLDLGDDAPIGADRITELLDGVLFDVAAVALRTGRNWHDAAQALVQVWATSGVSSGELRGVLGADPLGVHLTDGIDDIDDNIAQLGALAAQVVRSHPRVRVAVVSGWRIDAAGGSPAEVLGCVVACGVAYLRAMTAAGVTPDDAFRQIELQLPCGVDQFASIAALRAVRVMWARVADVLEVPNGAAHTAVHAMTSTAMLSIHDPWVNALRDTVACFAAAVGGADSIEVVPFDALLDRADREPGRRLARNTQSILALEANLGRVADPAAGSWYVESLTTELAEAGWAWFQEIEAAGGYCAAIDSGLIAERVAATWTAAVADVDTRRAPITGVSEFPNAAEPTPSVRHKSPPGRLPVHRRAERFEELRLRVEAGQARPAVFLAPIGTAAQASARLGYATSFFEIAGLEVVTLAAPAAATSSAADIVDAWQASGARAACVCSSDALYAEHAVDLVTALHAAGASPILIAGRPRDLDEPLRAAGLDQAIYVGCDARAILSDLIDSLLAEGSTR